MVKCCDGDDVVEDRVAKELQPFVGSGDARGLVGSVGDGFDNEGSECESVVEELFGLRDVRVCFLRWVAGVKIVEDIMGFSSIVPRNIGKEDLGAGESCLIAFHQEGRTDESLNDVRKDLCRHLARLWGILLEKLGDVHWPPLCTGE